MKFIKKKLHYQYSKVLAVLLSIVMIGGSVSVGVFKQPIEAATTTTLRGLIFDDKDLDGVLDSGEIFTSLSGMSAVLTLLSGDMSALNIEINADGSFRSLDSLGNPYYLENGTYKLTVTNENTDTSLSSARGFTPTTSSRHSAIGNPPFGSTSWYMDIPQGVPVNENSSGIAVDQSSAVYIFEVTENSPQTVAVGIGMASPVEVIFSAGEGFDFHFGQASDPEVGVLRNAVIGNNTIPALNGSVIDGYDLNTVTWILDKEVVLSDSTVIPAGTKLTNDQFMSVKVTENLNATASLELMEYDITYDYAQGLAPQIADPVEYNIEDTFPIEILNEPKRTGYTFVGWTVDYENEALTDVSDATRNYSVPAGTSGDIKLTAVWSANEYMITYNENASNITGVMNEQSVYYDENEALSENEFEREGYYFTGWNTEADSTGESYNDQEMFEPWKFTEDMNLYAQWERMVLVVEFIDYDGTVIKTESVTYGESANAPINPTRENYKFTGWDVDYSNITENLIVTAQYEEVVTQEPNPVDVGEEPTTPTVSETPQTTDTSNVPKTPESTTIVETGDNSNIVLLASLIGGSAIVLIGWGILYRNRKNK